MTSNKDDDALIGLFSTRGTQSRSIQRPTNSNVGSEAPATIDKASASRGTIAPTTSSQTSNSAQSVPRPSAKGQMSSLASTILREARRELGNDYNLQQSTTGQTTIAEKNIVEAVDKVLKKRGESIDDIERANVIINLQRDLMGWGILQPLIDNREVTDIHVYDYQTVVLQRGKISETTGLHWPNHQSYVSFIDRLLLRLGKSLSTQQHTIDASFPNGIRLCAIHESVCGQRGPLLCIRVPRIMEVSLESLVTYQVAPPLIVNYLAALTRSGHVTMMVAGETGTGKTTLIKCLATQFGPDESIVAVEDTPELNFQHPYLGLLFQGHLISKALERLLYKSILKQLCV
jgi:ABC-type multidrug transport system fused ATPase/permease subunit